MNDTLWRLMGIKSSPFGSFCFSFFFLWLLLQLKRYVVTIDGYKDVPSSNEQALLKAVAIQPVSVGICGSERAFQLYSKGIFTGPCSTSLNHAVLIVGYGSENGIDYRIINNSWGKSWGMSGFMHMLQNSGNSAGVCGINTLASYPIKTYPNPPPPPPPSPTPTKCDIFTSCSQGETCCANRIFGICFGGSVASSSLQLVATIISIVVLVIIQFVVSKSSNVSSELGMV